MESHGISESKKSTNLIPASPAMFLSKNSDRVSCDVTQRLDPSEQLQHIGHLRQAVKYVAEEVEGEDLPGFCLPKKVSSSLQER